MANFVVLVDPDADRRNKFANTVRPLLPPVDGLVRGDARLGNCEALWAAGTAAPIDVESTDEWLSVLWGEAMPADSDERLTAGAFRDRWPTPDCQTPDACDGFHAAAVYQGRTCVVQTDPLGLFPVYYFASGDVLLVGSSPELFRFHPLVRIDFNPSGLVGILLTNGLVDGETLVRGVRRLSPGAALRWEPAAVPSEIRQFEPPVTSKHTDLPFSAQVQVLDESLSRAASRHATAGERTALMLSGGRDSRLLAGYLQQNGGDVAAVTLGRPTDFDRQCAAQVVRALGFEHRCADVPAADYSRCAALSARWEQLAGGFNNAADWSGFRNLEGVAPRCVLGCLCDAIVGGSNIELAYSHQSRTLSFEQLFENLNSRGIRQDVLQRLLKRDVFAGPLEEVFEQCRSTYQASGSSEAARTYRFGLAHQERFHVGSMAWVCSFWSWPVIPVCDRIVLESVGGMPASSLAERRLQDTLLCTRFRNLAGLPLDRNSYDTSPLLLGPQRLLRLYLRNVLRRVGLANERRPPREESRYYHRIWDVNNPGWQAVRRDAEDCRGTVAGLFDARLLAKLLPAPDERLPIENVLWEASGPKLLLGFMLWAKEHL